MSSFARRVPGLRLAYETIDRLGDVQRELRQVHKRLIKLEGRRAISVPSVAERDERFIAVAEEVEKRTKLDQDRLWILWQVARNTAPLGLAALEAGSYKGGSAYFLAAANREHAGRELPLDAIDTFEGHPEQAITDEDHAYHEAGRFGDAAFDRVVEYLSPFAATRVHKGDFASVAPTLAHTQYGLAHLDMDLYLPTAQALAFCADRMPPGGTIVVDDYGSPKCPGIAQAAAEFLASHRDFAPLQPHTEQLVLVRVST